MTTLEDYFFTKKTKWILWGALAVVLGALVFHAGVVVGVHQESHGRMVLHGGGPSMLGGFMPERAYVESGHGAVGTIASVTLPTLLLQDRDGTMQKVYVSTSTVITGSTANTAGTLTSGQVVIIIGDPDDADDQGALDAHIIHLLPPPPSHMQASSSNSF